MKRITIILWNILTVLMILLLIIGLKYYDFLSFNYLLVVLGSIILFYIIVPLLFKKTNRQKVRIIENLIINGLFLR